MSTLKMVAIGGRSGEFTRLKINTGDFSRFCVSRDRQLIAGFRVKSSQIELWDVTSGKRIYATGAGKTKAATPFFLSPIGDYLIYENTSQRSLAIVRIDRQLDPSAQPVYGPLLTKARAPFYDPSRAGPSEVSAAFSPVAPHVATGGRDGLISIWDVTSGQQLGLPLDGLLGIDSLAYSSDGKYLAATGGYRARIWDVQSGKPVGPVLTLSENKYSHSSSRISFSPNGQFLVVTSSNGQIYIWDTTKASPVGRVLQGHSGGVNCLVFLPNGVFASGGEDGFVKWWNPEAGKTVGKSLNLKRGVISLQVSLDGTRFVCATRSKIEIWALGKKNEKMSTFESRDVHSLALSPNQRHLVVGAERDLQVWECSTSKKIATIANAHPKTIHNLQFNPEGTSVVSACWGSEVKIWDFNSDPMAPDALSPHGWPTATTRPDRWASPKRDKSLGWNLDDVAETKVEAPVASQYSGQIQIASDNTHAVYCVGNTLSTVDIESGRFAQGVEFDAEYDESNPVLSFALSPDSRTIITGHKTGSVRFWDLNSGESLGEGAKAHKKAVTHVAYHDGGKYIASGSNDKTIRFWNPLTLNPERKKMSAGGEVAGLSFHPTSDLLASSAFNTNSVILWNPGKMAVQTKLKGHPDSVSAIQFSPMGDQLGAVSGNEIWIWNWESQQPRLKIEGPRGGRFQAIAFSYDNQFLAAADSTCSTRLWHLSDGRAKGSALPSAKPTDPLAGFGGATLRFSRDNQRLVAGRPNQVIKIWNSADSTVVHAPIRESFFLTSPKVVSQRVSGETRFDDPGSQKSVTAISASRSGKHIAYSWQSLDGKSGIKIVGFNQISIADCAFEFRPYGITCLQAGAEDGTFLIGTVSGEVYEFTHIPSPRLPNNYRVGNPLYTQVSPILDVATCPSTTEVASFASNGTIGVFNKKSRHLAVLSATKMPSGTLEWHPNGSLLTLTNQTDRLQWQKDDTAQSGWIPVA